MFIFYYFSIYWSDTSLGILITRYNHAIIYQIETSPLRSEQVSVYYFGCHSILDKGSTVAQYKNDELEMIGLVVQASPEILPLCCVLFTVSSA